jgi:hypothetical protein
MGSIGILGGPNVPPRRGFVASDSLGSLVYPLYACRSLAVEVLYDVPRIH